MKLYCELCKKTQPVRIDDCRDAKTNEPYQDIVCAECDFVIASGTDIAQPEQEPVAWQDPQYKTLIEPHKAHPDWIPLYTAPPKREWVGLTDEDIDGIYKTHHDKYGKCKTGGFEYERTIEAKLKEKNGG